MKPTDEPTPLDRCTLAPGLDIPRIVTGMWQVADMERAGGLDPDETAATMAPYAAAGLDAFDMADHYGSAEVIAGRFGATPAGAAARFLTKWVPEPGGGSGAGAAGSGAAGTADGAGPADPGTLAAEVRAAVERARDRLGVERLDLLQYHAWRYSDPVWLDHLFHLQDLQREGLIAQLGLTNFDTDHLEMALETGIPIVSNQICFSLLDRRPLERMGALCERTGVKILAFGTLAGGLLTERWLGAPAPDVDALDTWSQMKYRRFVEVAGGWARLQDLLRVLDDVARRLGVSMANVATRWVLDQPGVGAVIVGARLGRSEHIADNLRVFGLELDAAAREELRQAAEALEPIPGDSGDEYRRPPLLTASGDLSHHVDAFPPAYPVTEVRSGRSRAGSGTPWEAFAGYSRAVREGRRILVSGTTATHGDRLIGGDSAESQAVFCLDKIQGAVEALGGRLEDVVRTRVFVRDIEDWEGVARAHGRRFGGIRPANTLVQAGLIGDGYRVEIEAEAVVEAP